ncbi:MAG TPA: DUF5666 domain-containing protein [Acidimicrobiales bacterium]|nr:DUF5666 domain-containing protein [Acidimicrobiales bacterium]
MREPDQQRSSVGARLLVVAGMVGALMTACGGRMQTVQVEGPAAATAAPIPAPPSGPVETFQGDVVEVDAVAGQMVVDVQMVWAPEFKSDPHQRVVIVDSSTRWHPAESGITGLRVGENVQVKGESGPDGTWHAVEIQLFDID